MSYFTVQNTDDELPEDVCERIETLADELIHACDSGSDNVNEQLNALSAAISFIISESVYSRSDAQGALAAINTIIISCIAQAELDGNVAWNRAVRH